MRKKNYSLSKAWSYLAMEKIEIQPSWNALLIYYALQIAAHVICPISSANTSSYT